MSTTSASMFEGRGGRLATGSLVAPPRLATLVYRSRCVETWSAQALRRMVDAAQLRNRAESITGLLICEEDRFFQWLEGPSDRLARVWHSIRQDPRHTDIEIRGDAPSPVRFFGDWDMKLATRQTLNPEAVRLAAAGLAASGGGAVVDFPYDRPWSRPDERLDPSLTEHPRVGELARLLFAADPDLASLLIDELHLGTDSMAQLCATVFEPAARGLGDLWMHDECSEFDVTLGLGRLQGAVRSLSSSTSQRVRSASRLPSVLVAPVPGERHALGATLDAEVLWQAGWDMRCELPATDAALGKLLASQWFDALDLSLSAAFEREHWLPRLARTIAFARASSRNPALAVVVGGRAFFERGDRHAQVGADAACPSALRIDPLLFGVVRTTV